MKLLLLVDAYFYVTLVRNMLKCAVGMAAIQRLKDVLDILTGDEVTKGPAKHTMTQSVIAVSATLLGAIVG